MRLLSKLNDYIDTEDSYVEDLHELIFNLLESLDYESLDEQQQEDVDNLVEMLDEDIYNQLYEDDDLDEARKEKVVRGGKVKKRLKPKKGYKVVGGKYVKLSATEKRKRSKGAKKAARKRRSQKQSIQRSRKRSMKKRSRIS